MASPGPRTWRYPLKYVASGLACAAVATVALYGVSRIVALRSDFNWFHAGCGILALAGLVATVGTAVWSLVVFKRRRSGRGKGASRPLLILSCAVFGVVPLVVGMVTLPSPSQRPADAETWAGYGTRRNGITSVTATWVQPRVYSLGSRVAALSLWVGLGDAKNHLEQIGTEAWCQRHTPAVYDAWYELYPARKVETGLPVRPGEMFKATILRLDQDRFRLLLEDETTGRRFSTIQVVEGVGNTHGSIITEESNFGDVDLAGFAPVRFAHCAFDGRPIADLLLNGFDIQADDGTMETTTSPITAGGMSFTVTRR